MLIFVNLVFADVAKSRAFYQVLGFVIKEQFSNEDAACVVLSESIYIMILARPFFRLSPISLLVSPINLSQRFMRWAVRIGRQCTA